MKAKEFIPASKPRNFVAKNQKTAGAGQHKDKRKAEKQGDVKHKNKQYDEGVAEGSLQEYGDTPKGQKMLTKVHKRAVDRMIKADDKRDAKDAKKNQQSANRAWDRFGEKEKYGESMSERIRDPEDWDEGNTEPPNNFAVYINGKKWKVFKGRGTYADDYREKQHHQQLKDWARKKSDATGKKWEVYVTGEPANESTDEGWKSKVAGAALASAAALGGGSAQAIEPLPIMATIKMQLSDGSVKTIKKDLGNSYDYRLDDAKKDLENLLDRKGIKNYTIHLDRYKNSDVDATAPKKTKDYMDKTPAIGKADNNKNYMDKGPYTANPSKTTYLDKSTGKEFRDMDNY